MVVGERFAHCADDVATVLRADVLVSQRRADIVQRYDAAALRLMDNLVDYGLLNSFISGPP
jgi:hypothetical protein